MNSDSLNMVSRLGEGHMPCTFFLSEPQLKTTVHCSTYVKTYFRTFQYNIFLHKYYCRLFVPNQRTQFYLKRLLTYVLLAANLISNYSIRTAYYAVTKKEGPCSANSLVTKPQTSPNACVTGPSEPGQSPPSPN